MQLSPTAADAGVKTAGRTLLSLSMNGHLLNVVKCGHGSLPTSKKLISFFLFLLMLLLCLPALTSRPLARLWVDHNPPDMEKLRKKSGGLGWVWIKGDTGPPPGHHRRILLACHRGQISFRPLKEWIFPEKSLSPARPLMSNSGDDECKNCPHNEGWRPQKWLRSVN